MTYSPHMIFVETPTFTKRILDLVSDDDYAELQKYLSETPEAGDIVEGTGGLRKVRMATNKGKSSGARIIYYYFKSDSQIAMVFVFAKNEQSNLTATQKKALKSVIKKWSKT